ncbi:hypothetical protein HOY82DRAFT_536667 [Tuber indicum]|nr:hypothetical protein HOY82DRAFT_536667 [Tuber indicum]
MSSRRLAVQSKVSERISSALLHQSLHTDVYLNSTSTSTQIKQVLLIRSNRISDLTIIPQNSAEGMPKRYTPSNTDTPTASYAAGRRLHPRSLNPSSNFLGVLADSIPTSPTPSTLSCPVSVCSLVFKGGMPHGYLWRHLNRPGVRGRTGDEKDVWLHLHKIQRDRLLATRSITSTPFRKHEANRVKAEKVSRTVEFELRATEMGITDKVLVDQKVAIWEGMCAAEQNGDIIEDIPRTP